MREPNDTCKSDVTIHPNNLEVNLTHRNLKSIPEDVIKFKYVRYLNLNNNSLTEIPHNINSLKSLLSLDLSHNKLKSLPRSLSEISQLKYLNISSNKFQDVPSVILESLQFLRILDLSYNEIKYFTDPPSCISNLIELNLCHNKLMKIPNWIFSVRCVIKNFDISWNDLVSMNENFLSGNVLIKLVTKIKILNLGNCNVDSERLHFISNMTSLETLKFSNDPKKPNNKSKNYLDNLNFHIFEKCQNLRKLHLSYTNVSILQNKFDYLTHLQHLDLEGNFLTWLPDSFCQLHSLQICNLSRNLISILPKDIGKLINLKEIYLNYNNITEIPSSFNFLVNLEYCDFYTNKIDCINMSIINMKSLVGIDLECNQFDFYSLCGDEESYNQFTAKYLVLKENYRKRIKEDRCDLQILQKDENFITDNDNLSESSENESKSLPDKITNEQLGRLNYGHEDWDGEISNWTSLDPEHDDFDPNVNYDIKLRWKRTNKNAFYSNFCPADNHIPSLRKYFFKKPQDESVEGQYDLN